MSQQTPSVGEIIDAPELAVLHVLATSLEAAELGLMAAYPDLELVAFGSDLPSTDFSMCLAEAVLNHLASLRIAIERYRSHVLHRNHVREIGSGL